MSSTNYFVSIYANTTSKYSGKFPDGAGNFRGSQKDTYEEDQQSPNYRGYLDFQDRRKTQSFRKPVTFSFVGFGYLNPNIRRPEAAGC